MTPAVAAVLGLTGLLALGKKLVDLTRMLTNWGTQKKAVALQVGAWAIFVGLVFLYGAAAAGRRLEILPGLSLSDLNGWGKLILGMQLGSTAGLVADYLQARDNHDSQALPPLHLPGLGGSAPHPAEPWQAEPGGPISSAAVAVTVKPELDDDDVERMRSQLHDALSPVVDAVIADAIGKAAPPAG